MTEIKLYKQSLKGLKIFVLTILFVVIGIWMINKEPVGTINYIVGWLALAFLDRVYQLGFFKHLIAQAQMLQHCAPA